jgi:FAD/FMN-containing dehydrogenase
VSTELAALDPATDLGEFGQVGLSPIPRAAISSPLIRLPADDLVFAFNLIRVPPTGDLGEAHRLVEANRAAHARIRAAGGTLYPVSAFPLSPPEWRDHFGPAFDLLAAAKRRYDPDDTLTPGYDIF